VTDDFPPEPIEAGATKQEENHLHVVALLTKIVKLLVDDPEAVKVQASHRHANTVLRLGVASSDVGKLIGKHGHTAQALRTLLSALSARSGHHYALDIMEGNSAITTDGKEEGDS
jgi:uncharacterized protein